MWSVFHFLCIFCQFSIQQLTFSDCDTLERRVPPIPRAGHFSFWKQQQSSGALSFSALLCLPLFCLIRQQSPHYRTYCSSCFSPQILCSDTFLVGRLQRLCWGIFPGRSHHLFHTPVCPVTFVKVLRHNHNEWVSFLNSAANSVGLLVREINPNLWTIPLGFGLKWFFNIVTDSAKVFSLGFAGLIWGFSSNCKFVLPPHWARLTLLLLTIFFSGGIGSKEELHCFTVFLPSLLFCIKRRRRPYRVFSPTSKFLPVTRMRGHIGDTQV